MDQRNCDDAATANAYTAQIEGLFRQHNRALIAFLYGRLRSHADAQELAQEVYLRMLGLERPARIESLRSYMFRIANNLAVDRLRMRKVRENAPADPPADDGHGAPVPERHAAALQQYQQLREALRELPAKTSRAFVLYAIEGLEFSAIARSMQLSERMVRYHVSHALAHCRARRDRSEAP